MNATQTPTLRSNEDSTRVDSVHAARQNIERKAARRAALDAKLRAIQTFCAQRNQGSGIVAMFYATSEHMAVMAPPFSTMATS